MSAEFDQYLKQMETLEKQKQGIIEKILEQRRALDEQLEKLGYSENRGSAKKGGRPKGSKNTQKRTNKKAAASGEQAK
jgi:hypothetical protein